MTKPNDKTEILTARTGVLFVAHVNGTTNQATAGQRVGLTRYVAAPDGGHLQTYSYCELVRWGLGTEAGMLGANSKIAEVRDARGATYTVAARLLDVYQARGAS